MRRDDSHADRARNLTIRVTVLIRRVVALALSVLLLAACATRLAPPGASIEPPTETTDSFVMPDGTRLPYRVWMPPAGIRPWAVALALHGMNDSRDAFELPAPEWARAGVAVFAPDQRGFGATATRGYWPGAAGLVGDARVMLGLLRARFPDAKHFAIGESMGAAVLMVAATSPDPPKVDGYILIAPAVWGRKEMNVFLRVALAVGSRIAPGAAFAGAPGVRVWASSNREAIMRLSRDPLTIKRTRLDAVRGLVDLMDEALAAAPRFTAPALFLYGGHDELVPKNATEATWRALPPTPPGDRGDGPRRAYYPAGWHLLLRDLQRAQPIEDILAWMRDPNAPLPSGAGPAARAWLADRD
jgi:acylglycerol lipase